MTAPLAGTTTLSCEAPARGGNLTLQSIGWVPDRVGTIQYFLDTSACIVDVTEGASLLDAAKCDQPLPREGSWVAPLLLAGVRNHRNESRTFRVLPADTQKIIVPAGSFDTIEIACTLTDMHGHPASLIHWYSRDNGVMVKSSARATDASTNEAWSSTEELQAYEPPDQEIAVSPTGPPPAGHGAIANCITISPSPAVRRAQLNVSRTPFA
jgi:hypothetical protein